MPIVVHEDTSVSVSDLEYLKILAERSLVFREIREEWYFDWTSTDLYPIIDNPCKDKECVQKRIEFYKDYQKKSYDAYMAENLANIALKFNYMAIPTLKHRFYETLIDDLITVVNAFGTNEQYEMWNDVKAEYLEQYRDYGQELAEQGVLGFAVSTTLVPIVEAGAEVVGIVAEPIIKAGIDIVKSTGSALLGSLLGENWKTKAIIIAIVIIVIVVLGLFGYQYSKTYITEKAKKKLT